MRDWPALLIASLWLIWLIYWLIAALGAKSIQRFWHLAAMAVSAALIGAHRWPRWLMTTLVPGGWIRFQCAVLLVIAGLAFSIWARAMLGSNWSGTVALKVDHELIVRGPYQWVRHPIYTGALIAVLGSGLAAGQVRGLLAFAIVLVSLWFKSQAEERFMLREFGDRYRAYRQSTWALLPLVI
jgi:protein-S-isoprenylcysteine O-methyltransferase Ste14